MVVLCSAQATRVNIKQIRVVVLQFTLNISFRYDIIQIN